MATRELYDLIQSSRWGPAIERCRLHPPDVEWRDDRGYTPLHRLACHHAVFSPSAAAQDGAAEPASAAFAMLRAADAAGFGDAPPSPPCGGGGGGMGALRLASDRSNRAMWSPLHLLCLHGGCHEGAAGLARVLLLLDHDGGSNHNDGGSSRGTVGRGGRISERARRLASLRDRQGRTALHFLSESGVPPAFGMIDVLLAAEPSLVIARDGRGDTPLSNLVSKGGAPHHFLRVFLSTAELTLFPDAIPGATSRPDKGRDDIAAVEPRNCSAAGQYSRRNLIHTAVRVPAVHCPPSLVVRVIANESARFVREWDENGNLPLHVFASNYHVRYLAGPSIGPMISTFKGQQDRARLDRASIERANAFAALLGSYPESVFVRNKGGKYPLQLASEAGTNWMGGISQLITANPMALAAMDLDLSLYPQVLALIVRNRESSSLTTAFHLIKARPDLAECCIQVEDKESDNHLGMWKKVSSTLAAKWAKSVAPAYASSKKTRG